MLIVGDFDIITPYLYILLPTVYLYLSYLRKNGEYGEYGEKNGEYGEYVQLVYEVVFFPFSFILPLPSNRDSQY